MFGFHLFPEALRPFNTQYKCFSVAMMPNGREDVDRGGKIILPPSALDHLTRLNISYPMLFKLTNRNVNRTTHSGVLEFVAEEGKAFLPYWIMRYLLLDEGDMINVEYVSLPVATYSKFQPQSTDFLDITNPKAVLENCLRNFACLSTGDIIAIPYNERIYELFVVETKPGPAVSIIECDMNVDFAPPVGYTEPTPEKPKEMIESEDLLDEHSGFYAFKGKGNRLDGKQKKRDSDQNSPPLKRTYQRGIPDYDYKIGELTFNRNVLLHHKNNKECDTIEEDFEPFKGKGHTLRKGK